MFINHEGIAVVSRPGIRVAKVSVKVRVITFEHLYCRATIGGASSILIVLYRPGSSSPSSGVFTEFTGLLEHMSSFALPVTIIGDLNIHFEREGDVHARKTIDILNTFGLIQRSHHQLINRVVGWMSSSLQRLIHQNIS